MCDRAVRDYVLGVVHVCIGVLGMPAVPKGVPATYAKWCVRKRPWRKYRDDDLLLARLMDKKSDLNVYVRSYVPVLWCVMSVRACACAFLCVCVSEVGVCLCVCVCVCVRVCVVVPWRAACATWCATWMGVHGVVTVVSNR